MEYRENPGPDEAVATERFGGTESMGTRNQDVTEEGLDIMYTEQLKFLKILKLHTKTRNPPKGTLESEYSEPLRIIQDLRLQKEGQLLEGSPYLNPSNSNPFVTNCPHNFSPVLPLPFA
jgi:hypothetical protein